jgi:hypothetical protein
MNQEDLIYLGKKAREARETKEAIEWAMKTSNGPSFTKSEMLSMSEYELKRVMKNMRERKARNQILANCIELSEKIDVEKELYRRTHAEKSLKHFLYYKRRRDRNLASLRKIYVEKMKTYETAARTLQEYSRGKK